MSAYQQQIDLILRNAREDSDADVALVAEASRLADLHRDVNLGIKTRLRLISIGSWSGNHETALAAFIWCLAQLDADPGLAGTWERSLLWHYSWIVENLSDYPEATRAQLDQTLADMAHRYDRGGYGQSAVHKSAAYVALRLGDIDRYHKARDLWQQTPRGVISYCIACQTNTQVNFSLELGEYESAMETAQPIIKGRQSCKAIPCITFSRLLLPATSLGWSNLTQGFQRRSFRQAMSNREYLDSAACHCAYLALAGEIPKALSVFETTIVWAMTQKRAWERLVFFECAMVLFEIVSKSAEQSLTLRIPQSAPFYSEDGTYAPAHIFKSLSLMQQQLIALYNQRNGNTYMQQRYDRFRAMVKEISQREHSV